MACYHPMTGIVVGETLNGKKKIVFAKPFQDLSGVPEDKLLRIPCGQCIGCRLEYSRQWANRCMMEAQFHEENWFLTLTYDDEHVPINAETDDNGELVGEPVMTLVKRDFQLFMKRLRKEFGNQKLRFYACGEYGSKTFRPHYHAIIFGLKLDDLKIYKRNFQGDILYNSPRLERCWKNGFCVAANVTWETCAYTARYVMKKAKGVGKEVYASLGVEPEFVLMSRKPGIAHQFFELYGDSIYEHDRVYLSDKKRGIAFRPPRYFDMLYDVDHPDKLELIKHARKTVAKAFQEAAEKGTDLHPDHYREIQEEKAELRMKGLVRPL